MAIEGIFRFRRTVRLAIILVLLLVAGWILADMLAGVKLRREIATYRELELPLSPDKLTRPDIRPEENAGLMYERAFRLLTSTEVKAKRRAMRLPSPEEWMEREADAPSILEDADFRIAMDFGMRGGARPHFSIASSDDFDWDTAFRLNNIQLLAAVEATE